MHHSPIISLPPRQESVEQQPLQEIASGSELEATCASCPAEQDVEALLQQYGFRLTFQRGATLPPTRSYLGVQPAQYHYSDPIGTKVLYLAGKDDNTTDRRLPTHASRFWLIVGAQPVTAIHVATALNKRWNMAWSFSTP